MKYIARFYDRDTLHRSRELLRSKGIPTYVVQEEPPRMGAHWALFVCLAEQAPDALRVLRNPAHSPMNPIDAGAFERALDNPDTRILVRLALVTFLIGAPILIAVIFLVWRYA